MKKAFALILALVLTSSLVACSGASSSTPAGSEASTTATVSEAGGEESSAEPAASEAVESEGTVDDEFNPDNENGISIEDIRAEFGAVPLPEEALKVGVVAKQFQNEFWRIFKEGYEAGIEYANEQGANFTIDVQAAQDENDEQGQLAIVNNMINQGYGTLLLSPISDGNLVPGVETANEKGIPVVNVNDGLIKNAPKFVGPRAYENGELAAEWISDKLVRCVT